jgi:hypothetical protein
MTELLEEAILRLRQLPDAMQDNAARAVLLQLEEEPERGDSEAISESRLEYQRSDFSTFEQLRHEVGPGSSLVGQPSRLPLARNPSGA